MLDDPTLPRFPTGPSRTEASRTNGRPPGVHGHFVSSAELEEVFANIPKWRIEHQVLSGSSGENYSEMIMVGSVAVTSELLTGRVRTSAETPRKHIAIGLEMAGVSGRQFGGRPLSSDEALIGSDGAELDYLHPAGFLGLSMTMPMAALEQDLANRFGLDSAASHYRAIRASKVDRTAAAESWRFFERLMDMLHASRASVGQMPGSAFLEIEIVDVMASVIGNHLQTDDTGRFYLWSQRRPVVRRAEEFMRAHLSEPIALHEICAAARASERTVEYGFREMYGMGAKKFLQVLRLNHARRLFRFGGNAVSVQDGAAAAGFWHMGHFSANYRRLFGETPSETIRRSR